MSDLTPYFEKAINSPEGKIWSQQLWFNYQKAKPLVYGNSKGKTTNGHPFEGELDLNLKTSRNGKQYALGFLKLQDDAFELIVFPASRKGMDLLKYDGYISIGRLAERKIVANVEVMEFLDSKTKLPSYSLRLKPPRASAQTPKQDSVSTPPPIAEEPSKRGWSARPF